jgi:DNA polymerase-3 subunit gamma/tau
MSSLPFARKYRPQTFADLIGQPHVAETLTRALKDRRVAQAYLFAGIRGVGKTSAARILAKCLNCEQGPTPAPCQRCANCVQVTAGSSLDVTEIDGASNRGIDEIRALRDTVPFAPTTGGFHVYIIDEVHMLTTEAFNALLKTLEEPPAHAKFILATTAPGKVPATILSRCQRFDFRRADTATLVAALKAVVKAEKLKAEDAALFALARAADGSLRDAEVLLEQVASFAGGTIAEADVTALLGLMDSEALLGWTDALLRRDAAAALEAVHAHLRQGREPAQLLANLLQHVRNLLVIRSIGEAPGRRELLGRLVDEPAERLSRLEAQAAAAPAEEWVLWLQILHGAYEMVRRSPMAQAVIELAVIKVATREAWQSLDAISRRLEQAGQGQGTTAPPRPLPVTPPAPARTPSAAPAVPPTRAPAAPPTREAATAPEAAAVSAPEDLAAAWPAFLERLAMQKMSLAAYLAESRPLREAEGLLTVGLPGFALHQEVLTAVEHQRLIERLLSELCQRALRVRYEILPPSLEPVEAAADAEDPTPPVVQDIVKLFNATILPPRTI